MLLYAPIYLSSYCINHCTYCGFRHPNEIPRKHLTLREALRQAEILCDRGFRHILLVAGDYPRLTTTRYFAGILRELAARGVAPSIEIAPQSTESYSAMVAAGACGITLYQETYDEDLYALYHPRGSKVSFDWRLEALDRAAEAGIARLGLGFLLGLGDPREDLLAMLRHARYLQSRYAACGLAFSLPRIHEAPAGFEPPCPVERPDFRAPLLRLEDRFSKGSTGAFHAGNAGTEKPAGGDLHHADQRRQFDSPRRLRRILRRKLRRPIPGLRPPLARRNGPMARDPRVRRDLETIASSKVSSQMIPHPGGQAPVGWSFTFPRSIGPIPTRQLPGAG